MSIDDHTDNHSLPVKLQCEVVYIVFENAENGYKVMKAIDENGQEQTICGNAFGIETGSFIVAEGEWVQDKKYGRQFRAVSCIAVLPESPIGVKRFLGSGIIPGIGRKLAEQIVDVFGAETLEVLDHHSNRLRDLPGIGKKKLATIRAGWQKFSERRNSYIFLQGLGITPAFCNRIYQRYGEGAGQVVKANPYKLAYDVDGIGFLKADEIARNLGFAADSLERGAAAAAYLSDKMSAAGNCCYPEEALRRELATLLQADENLAQKGIDAAVTTHFLVRDSEMIYPAVLYQAECELPRHVARLVRVKKHAGERLRRIPPVENLILSQEQLQAVKMVADAPLSIITGGPGVGKTTVLGEIVRRGKAAGLKIVLAAPTGRAAKRLSEAAGGMEAKTLHRLLIFDPTTGHFQYDYQNQLDADLILVDEVSMLDLQLALALFQAIRAGSTLVLIGDADQLPSVGAGQVLDDFLHSDYFAVTRLTKIFRQDKAGLIIQNAHAVNAGVMPQLGTQKNEEQLLDFYFIEQEDDSQIFPLLSRLLDRIVIRFHFDPVEEVQILTPMNRGSAGTATLNRQLQDFLNPADAKPIQLEQKERVFRVGDKVMQISNNYDKNVFNGDIGRIVALAPGERQLTVRFDAERIIPYKQEDLDELMHAYAMTIHKSQGCEFPVVIMTVLPQHYMMLQRNLLYTGMTRAKKLLLLVGSKKAIAMAVGNVRKDIRYSLLSKRLDELHALLRAADAKQSVFNSEA